jgi:hypothetical protein
VAFTPTLAGQKLTSGTLNDIALCGVTTFRAYCNTAQVIANRATENVADAVIWDTIDLDLFGAWSSGAGTRWTCPKAGWWTISGSIGFSGSSAGTLREAIWFQNGALLGAGRGVSVVSTAIATTALTAEARTLTVLCPVGDYIELIPLQNTGSTLALSGGSLRSYMTVTYSGPS